MVIKLLYDYILGQDFWEKIPVLFVLLDWVQLIIYSVAQLCCSFSKLCFSFKDFATYNYYQTGLKYIQNLLLTTFKHLFQLLTFFQCSRLLIFYFALTDYTLEDAMSCCAFFPSISWFLPRFVLSILDFPFLMPPC